MPKRVVTGIVTSDKTAKTRRVEITRLVRHPRYGKILRRKTVCTVHDEEQRVARGRPGGDRRIAAAVADQALGAGAGGDEEPVSEIAAPPAVAVCGRGQQGRLADPTGTVVCGHGSRRADGTSKP